MVAVAMVIAMVAFVTFFSFCVNEGKFPNIFKQTNVNPAYKKGYRGYKESYHRILSVIAKIFENLFRKQGATFMDQFLSKNQCDFRKSYIAQYCLLAI